MGTEPCLQPLTGEQLYKTANDTDDAHNDLDVVAETFWSKSRQSAFFNVKVFNPFKNTPLGQAHWLPPSQMYLALTTTDDSPGLKTLALAVCSNTGVLVFMTTQ